MLWTGSWLPFRGISPISQFQDKLTDTLGISVRLQTEMIFAIYTQAAGGGAVWALNLDGGGCHAFARVLGW